MEPDVGTEALVRDVHPVEVLLPDGRVVAGARVFVTTRRLLAYCAGERGIERVCDLELERLFTMPPSRRNVDHQIEIRVADGTTVWIKRGRGCGCGSPLKMLATPAPWAGA